jgi:hypothetical protein
LSPEHFEQCIRYVELNPVRAELVDLNRKYEWVSNNIHFGKETFISEDFSVIRGMTRTGRPQGNKQFLENIYRITGIDPFPRKGGRRSRNDLICNQSGVP